MSTPSDTKKDANSEGKSRSGYKRNLNYMFDLIVVFLLTSFMVVSFMTSKQRTLEKLGRKRRHNFMKRRQQRVNQNLHAVATVQQHQQQQRRKAGKKKQNNLKHRIHPKNNHHPKATNGHNKNNHKQHHQRQPRINPPKLKRNRHLGKNYTHVEQFLSAYNGTNNLLLPLPIILLGLPKAGTTSIANFFRCNDLYVSHNHCKSNPIDDNEKGDLCSHMLKKNVKNDRPIFENTGYFHVYAQFEHIDKCFFPQMTHLEDIHNMYPNATFILNTRNVDNWLNSTRHWRASREESMSERLNLCDYSFFKDGISSDDKTTDDRLKDVFLRQADNARQFATKHPSHHFVEVAIDDSSAGDVLGEAFFGVADSKRERPCWNVHNANTERKSRAWKRIRENHKKKKLDVKKKKKQGKKKF